MNLSKCLFMISDLRRFGIRSAFPIPYFSSTKFYTHIVLSCTCGLDDLGKSFLVIVICGGSNQIVGHRSPVLGIFIKRLG